MVTRDYSYLIRLLWKTPLAGFFFCNFCGGSYSTDSSLFFIIPMKTLFFVCCSVLFLSGCSLQSWLEKVVEWDKKHAGVVTLGAEDIKSRISSSGNLDLSNLNLPAVPDICALLDAVDLRGIVSLDLSNNQIQNVAGLDCLPSLKDLNLSNNQIDSFVGFPLMENLEKLNIAKNQLTDLSGIEVLKWIIELQLGENYLEDLVGIENLANLEKLGVEFNKLKNIDVLQYLDQLKEVNAKYNEIKGKIDELREKIPNLIK